MALLQARTPQDLNKATTIRTYRGPSRESDRKLLLSLYGVPSTYVPQPLPRILGTFLPIMNFTLLGAVDFSEILQSFPGSNGPVTDHARMDNASSVTLRGTILQKALRSW